MPSFPPRRLLTGLLHLLFWTVSAYVITEIFCATKVELYREETTAGGLTQRVVRNYDTQFVRAVLLTVCLSAVICYANVFRFLPDYFRTRHLPRYLARIGGLTTAGVLLDVLVNKFANYQLTVEQVGWGFPSVGLHLFLFAFYIAVSFAYAFTREWYRSEQLKNAIVANNLKTELDFLRTQVNPHFLFNTLNNLYSIAQKHRVGELSTGIQELAKLMRYMLYESSAELVPLAREVRYLESFIGLQQLRHEGEDELLINFTKEGDWQRTKIAPMILLPFVENACKHGFSLNESSVVSIRLGVEADRIRFRVSNTAYQQRNFADPNSGIGLGNVTRRLELIYPGRHTLDITEADRIYTVTLDLYPHAQH